MAKTHSWFRDLVLLQSAASRAIRKFRDKKHVIATLKHFVGHAEPESGQNCAPANVSMRVLRETFLFTFKEVLKHAGAISIMPSYNEVDGVPSHANNWLLRDVLRKEWGFKGYLVSDYYAIWELNYRPDTHGHFLAEDKKKACALAVKAGVNIELPDPDCYLHLEELVKKGVLKEKELDELVAPMLYWKFVLGLFDDPYVDPEIAAKVVGSEANRELALQAAHETITLLKNEGNLLPLNAKKLKSIAVIGPNANRSLLGGYSGVPEHNVTVLDGIKAKVGKHVEVLYSEGCKITIGGSWNIDPVVASDPAEDRKQIAEAVEVAKNADVIVLAIGGNEQTSREAWARNHMGDRTSLDLIGRQNELVEAMVALGKPVVALVFNGRPLSITELSKSVPAIFECWYMGQETGRAVADALFGDVNPGGKLPITIPRSVGHLPAFYNYKPSARRGYLFDDATPLYPFGFGLSYTSFEITNPRLAKKKIGRKGHDAAAGGSEEYRQTRGQRSGADVHPRPLQFRDAAGQGAEGLQEGLAGAGRKHHGLDRHHARSALVLRHQHEVRRRTGRLRDHGRQLLARCRPYQADAYRNQVSVQSQKETCFATVYGFKGCERLDFRLVL